ncbi:MAG: dihydrofolate reductase [Fermentimonas sp.]|nr:dihydrofolate reductase [Fermentimonas sp.]MBF6598356.1 dihydrofolate reductase [Fermentimonas sp.]
MIKEQKTEVAIIVVVDENNGIGKDGDLLCHLPNDLKHFKKLTTGHTIIMGRKTYESLPNGALPNRINIVITSDNANNYPGCIVVRSIDEAFLLIKDKEKVFIIGGGKIYDSTLHLTNKLYLTRIHHIFEEADTFFPKIDFNNWELIVEEKHKADEKNQFDYSFITFIKKE